MSFRVIPKSSGLMSIRYMFRHCCFFVICTFSIYYIYEKDPEMFYNHLIAFIPQSLVIELLLVNSLDLKYSATK